MIPRCSGAPGAPPPLAALADIEARLTEILDRSRRRGSAEELWMHLRVIWSRAQLCRGKLAKTPDTAALDHLLCKICIDSSEQKTQSLKSRGRVQVLQSLEGQVGRALEEIGQLKEMQ